MQEPKQTTASNCYYDLVSILYHALEESQTSNTYIRDAQSEGNQDLQAFFQEIQQDANRQADKAKQLLGKVNA